MPETQLFQALGSFETLGSKLSHGTSLKFADVRTHLRKVSKMNLSSNLKRGSVSLFFYASFVSSSATSSESFASNSNTMSSDSVCLRMD